MRSNATLPALALLVGLLTVGLARGDDRPVRFDAEIAPILKAHCLKCHGDGRLKGGLDLRHRAALLEGGDSGPAVVPGKPADSVLVQRVEKGEMPPPEIGKLTDRQRELLRRWVADGAPMSATAPPPAETPARVSAEDRDFWAFQPPRRPDVLRVKNLERVRNPIDAFLLAKLEAKGLTFNPDAAREVLLRRLRLDLHGLPPTPEQREEFLADGRPDAYERLVDRLLTAPEYGERWGRHWLDLAGYADSDGYLAADRLRPEAWRYRDYVIQSLNADLPYDRFLTEQLAGDELSDWRRAEKFSPEVVRQLTATGFLRTASDPTYPGYTEPNEIHQVMADTMQIVGTTFLGLTVQCARCHAHKFDPISLRDYYALQTVFLPALDPARWQPSGVRGIRLASEPEWAAIQKHNRQVDEQIKPLNARLTELTKKAGKEPDATAKAAIDQLKATVAQEQAKKKPIPVLLRGLADLDGKLADGRVLQRGDYNKPGATVPPGVPEVLTAPGYALPIKAGERTSGRRLALARWLTDPAHPLTARVQVNRMWAQHFGRGLVPTVANFGRSGARPSHPELLDWLATEFVRSGWSLKHMHRLMVTSSAYRQASDVDPAKRAADPDNTLLGTWRPRRLEGEAVRDSVLAVAGKLSDQRFGPPAPVQSKSDGSVETADDAQGNRRSVYLLVRRSQHLTLLDLFDTPMMEINCPERNVSTVPLQALALLHAPFTQRNAEALADRILKSAATDDARLTFAFRSAFARDPRPSEAERFRAFLQAAAEERQRARPKEGRAAAERAAWVQAALVLLNSNEFVYVP